MKIKFGKEKILKLRELNDDEEKNLFLPNNFRNVKKLIYVCNGEYYVAKFSTCKEIRNEFIGSCLAKVINLDTVEYKLVEQSVVMYMASKLFFEKGFEYGNAYSLFGVDPRTLLTNKELENQFSYLCKTDLLERIEDRKLRTTILKLIMLDLKMFQCDRHEENIILKTKDGVTSMEKAFDFGGSYCDYQYFSEYYKNAFIMLRRNKASLRLLAEKFPEVSTYANILSSINISDVLWTIEQENNIHFGYRETMEVRSMDRKVNRLLKSIK